METGKQISSYYDVRYIFHERYIAYKLQHAALSTRVRRAVLTAVGIVREREPREARKSRTRTCGRRGGMSRARRGRVDEVVARRGVAVGSRVCVQVRARARVVFAAASVDTQRLSPSRAIPFARAQRTLGCQ